MAWGGGPGSKSCNGSSDRWGSSWSAGDNWRDGEDVELHNHRHHRGDEYGSRDQNYGSRSSGGRSARERGGGSSWKKSSSGDAWWMGDGVPKDHDREHDRDRDRDSGMNGSWQDGGNAKWGSWASARNGGGNASGHRGRNEAVGDRREVACADAKLRLVRLRGRLQEGSAEALVEALKRKRDSLGDDLPLQQETLKDLRMVLEKDFWDGQPSGRQWLNEWLKDGEEWMKHLQQWTAEAVGPNYCSLCWRPFSSASALQKHMDTKEHQKRHRTWTWKYGLEPEAVIGQNIAADDQFEEKADAEIGVESASGSSTKLSRRAEVFAPVTHTLAGAKAGSKAQDILAQADRTKETPTAAAKTRLLQFRNNLDTDSRRRFVEQLGLARANDVADLAMLQAVFPKNVSADLAEVLDVRGNLDLNWIWKEPTFSWLSGFYWHPQSTSLEQVRDKHSEFFCHLCEAEVYNDESYQQHLVSRRHAENALHWAEANGNLPYPDHCYGCPGSASSSTWYGEAAHDLEHRRAAAVDVPVCAESVPPHGFKTTHDADQGKVKSLAYVAIVVQETDCRIHAVRVASGLQLGPKEKPPQGRRKRWVVDLNWLAGMREWRSLAIPVPESFQTGEAIEFAVQARWSDTGPWEDISIIWVTVPNSGLVAVQRCKQGQKWQHVDPDQVPIFDFIASGQVEAAGGLGHLRGTQLPFQFATRDVMLSFLLYIPEAEEPGPLLVFFHGDMPRGILESPQPGLADFCDVYGPALFVTDTKKKGRHPCRDFVVLTPCCPEEFWWLRHPALHDSTAYVASMETCLRGIINWTYELRISDATQGARFAGQSMGAYMALEMARAMPEGTGAVVAGAPCFDACRLEHLARRLINVPVWLLIGRNDSLCSFEEVASLALRMRDLDAKFVRLTSVGIKGHSEVGKKLEKAWIYEWLKNPLE